MINPASKYRRPLPAWGLLFSLVHGGVAAAPLAAPLAERQDIAELEDLARNAATAVLPPLQEGDRLQIGPIQPGLRLPHCASPRAERAPGIQVAGRALIELRCPGPVAWHLYVPVKIIGTVPVVLAAHALVSGMVLTPQDVIVERRDRISLPPGYFDDGATTVGLTVGRAIAGGAVLTNQALVGTKLVQRGQRVTLTADGGGITVRMPGRALSDGLLNQRIRVENLSSGKIVEGIARSAQVVEIVF